MKVSLTPKNSIALLSLSFIMQETHEIAHTVVGRIICGCWGKRNFNLWGLCSGCSEVEPLSILATSAGPFYTFSIIWIGYFLLFKSSPKLKSIGFALIIASMPLSRILTPIFGSGDEIYALNKLWNNHTLAWIVGLLFVFALVIPPVVKVWNVIGNKRKILWFIGLLLVPFLMTGAIVFGILQSLLLENGVMNAYWILGSPKLVTVWLTFLIIVFTVFSKSISTLLRHSPENKDNNTTSSVMRSPLKGVQGADLKAAPPF